MRAKSILLSSAGLALLGTAMPVLAQQASNAPAAAREDESEIVVTARKRKESILEVPVVESVLSQAQLERSQVFNVTDIAAKTPGLILGKASLEIGTQVSLRGIGTTSLDPGIDQSVSLNLDGLQISQGSAYSVGVFDMQQVEVLKGPQALFFGKNSPGGVVSIRTNDPGDKFEVIGRSGYEFRGRQSRNEGIVSGPITDTFGVRVAALYDHYGGYFINQATPITSLGAQPTFDHRFGKSNTFYLRTTAVWKPTSDFTVRVKANYTRDLEDGGTAFQLVSCPDGLVNYTGIQFYSSNEDCKLNRNLSIVNLSTTAFPGLRHGGVPFTHIYQKFGTVEVNWNVAPKLALTSVTGYYNLLASVMQNGTLTGAAATTLAAQKQFRRKEFTQEFRLNSDYSGPFNFTAGAFYQHATMKNNILIAGNTALGLPGLLQAGTHDVPIHSASAFVQARYKIVPPLEISLGARYTDEKRHDDAVDFGDVLGTIQTPVSPSPPRLHSKNWSPELTITYKPNADLTIFGSLKQGYKSGSYNLIVPVFPGQNNSFGDERIRGGEVGLKARAFDRQLFFNVAGYYYKYKGLQVGVNTTTNGVLVLKTLNAGAAKIYGVDFDATYNPMDLPGLSINAALNYNHARFTSFPGAPCYGGQTIAAGCNQGPVVGGLFTTQDLSGAPLPRAPLWQANLGATYEMPVNNDWKLTFGVDGQYSSKYSTNTGKRPDYFQKAFGKINANVAIAGPNNGWELAFIANNITDKLTTANCTNLNYAGGQILPGVVSGGPASGPSGTDELICSYAQGRELWVRLTVRPADLFARD